MKPSYKKPLINLAMIWSACLVLFLFAYMIVFSPQRQAKNQIDDKFNETAKLYEISRNAADKATQDRLNKQLEALRDNVKTFVTDNDSAGLLLGIKKNSDGKKLWSFSNKTAENTEIANSKYICENHIYVTFTAGFNQFAEFVNALERYRPVVFVDKFFITRSDDVNGGNEVSASFAVFTVKRQAG
jgi:hypothetical protein